MKKLTIEFIREKFAERGYTLVSDVYINSKIKLNYICNNGHEHMVTWEQFCKDVGCGCFRHVSSISYENVRDKFEAEGYVLLSTSYTNTRAPLKYMCAKGHSGSTSLSSWNTGHRCKRCAGKAKTLFTEVKESFEAEGYTLLSTEYISNNTKLDFICDKGHTHSIKWNNWQQGQRCFYCNGAVKPGITQIKEEFEKEGYTLVSVEYKDAKTKLEFICDKGHKHSIRWGSWKLGQRCPYCAGKAKYTIDQVRQIFLDKGCTLISTVYINSHTKLDYVCKNGHEHSIRFRDFNNGGYGCPVCRSIGMSGSKNCNWNNGISFDEYCAVWKDKEYKQSIRDRDQNKCLNPYCGSKGVGRLVVHHINYDKKDCHFKNLITLCHECNIKANKDRDWHKDWYQALLHNRYGYNY